MHGIYHTPYPSIECVLFVSFPFSFFINCKNKMRYSMNEDEEREGKKPNAVCMVSSAQFQERRCAYKSVNITDSRVIRRALDCVRVECILRYLFLYIHLLVCITLKQRNALDMALAAGGVHCALCTIVCTQHSKSADRGQNEKAVGLR